MRLPGKRVLVVPAIIAGILVLVAWLVFAVWRPFSRSPDAITVSGNIEAHESVLSFNAVQARIVELPFDEGRAVHAGAMLARVDDAVYRQQIRIADAALAMQQRQQAAAVQSLAAARKTILSDEADLAQKTTDFRRVQDLWTRHYVSTDSRDLARTAVKQSTAVLARDHALVGVAQRNLELAQASVHNAAENLRMARVVESYTTLVAPYGGVILLRQAELGEVVAPGTPIFTLADLDHVWLRAYINETDLGKVRLGEPVMVTNDTYPGKRYRGRISFIASSAEFTPKSVETHAERVTLVYRIRIDIDNPTHELLPGMPADARIALLSP
ncbi:MAG: efflux RND transporter periplasmic adaptor subunit [Xanthomonadaceae bacterium]|nr:efflux RND transporter periplasmic adaptor subunit [Xanthomonadaceae bacterium]